MLFSSYEFIILFLPVTLVVYFLLLRQRLGVAARSWLLFASVFFYGWWDARYIPLILGSILFNYTIGGTLVDYDDARKQRISKHAIFVIGLVVNILLLGWFKYTDFFISTGNVLTGTDFPLLKIVLPLGISFFTITQIAFLVDAYEGLVEERNLLNYALFVTFFPHLLAGPILHHKEMMPQFDRLRNKVIDWRNIYLGLGLFLIGLFKKVVVADTFAVWAKAGFASSEPLHLAVAWITSLSYTLQLYFDFSGYSDMAIGIGWMFNIRLPLNFNSPYRATGLIDFWKRWHITLTNFVTTYLYTPLLRASGRITFARSMAATFVAMLISGFWHGAGWTFIVWGGLHGGGLVVNHVWRRRKLWMPTWLAWLITFNFVNMAFVFFRADSVGRALGILKGMCGGNGVVLHKSLNSTPVLSRLPIVFDRGWLKVVAANDKTIGYIALALLAAYLCRNSTEIVQKMRPAWTWFAAMLVVFVWTMFEMGRVSEFLYFQF